MNASELTKLVGKQGTITLEGLTIPVTTKDARMSFGGCHVLIEPVHGSGEKWVEAKRVALAEGEGPSNG